MEIKLMKGGEIWRSVEKSTNDLFNAVKEIMPPTDEADELMEDIEAFRYMELSPKQIDEEAEKTKLPVGPMLRIFVKDNRITEAIIHADGLNLPGTSGRQWSRCWPYTMELGWITETVCTDVWRYARTLFQGNLWFKNQRLCSLLEES
ncbi:uncharacterized protein LOC124123330 [Haliotis rufescens]|uniref:uncharacterized protein LOC124123330 n=1 Tax=Haliotis rufescens TaxID=6454 RepID=UPI001EAFA003|nr:uncharacterized protein LOC124123330 [Haliotis rufescens]